MIMQLTSLSFLIYLLSCALGLNITNPPQNVTVCINDMAEINCGFTGANPLLVLPNWIIFNNGRFANNETVLGPDIALNRVSGFVWVPDVNSGAKNAPNSKLLFGPVNKTHNQSLFQCVFMSALNQVLATSSIGTITVVGPPSVNITIDEVCITSITLSVTIYSHSACAAFSHHVNLISSNGTILPISNNGSTYTFDGLAANTSYDVIVTVIYDSGTSDSQVFNELTRTHSLIFPRAVNVNTIEVLTLNNRDVIIYWKDPNSDTCLMSETKFYDVNVRCDNGESLLMKTGNTIIIFSPSDRSSNQSNISCMITIVVYNNEGMSSQPSSKTFVIIGIENNTGNDINNDSKNGGNDCGGSGSTSNAPIIENTEEDNHFSGSENDEICNEVLIGLTSLLTALLAIATIIIVVLSYKLYNQHDKKGRKSSSPVVQHLNVDNIEMQSSPAYVSLSLDNKVSSAVADYEIPVAQPPVK